MVHEVIGIGQTPKPIGYGRGAYGLRVVMDQHPEQRLVGFDVIFDPVADAFSARPEGFRSTFLWSRKSPPSRNDFRDIRETFPIAGPTGKGHREDGL